MVAYKNLCINIIYCNKESWPKCQHCTKIKLSIKDFFSKYDQIRGFLRIWSHLLKKSLIENFIFVHPLRYYGHTI